MARQCARAEKTAPGCSIEGVEDAGVSNRETCLVFSAYEDDVLNDGIVSGVGVAVIFGDGVVEAGVDLPGYSAVVGRFIAESSIR